MTDVLAIVDRLVVAYNAKDFATVESLLAPHLDFAHFNRAFAFDCPSSEHLAQSGARISGALALSGG